MNHPTIPSVGKPCVVSAASEEGEEAEATQATHTPNSSGPGAALFPAAAPLPDSALAPSHLQHRSPTVSIPLPRGVGGWGVVVDPAEPPGSGSLPP